MSEHLVVGLDLGTGGVRAVAVDAAGIPAAQAAVPLAPFRPGPEPTPNRVHEQCPEAWWQAVCQCLLGLQAALAQAGHRPAALCGIAVDGTSGTILAIDADHRPIGPALMYNDPRAGAEAEILNTLAGGWCEQAGIRFDASYGLAKILWLANHEPQVQRPGTRFLHQADYIVGKLTGEFGCSDYCNALKSGFDLQAEQWPTWFTELPGVRERLPTIVAPGSELGIVSQSAAALTGLPAGMKVMAGATDGVAAAVAAGLGSPGEYNTTVGTTLVFKGVSRRLVRHPQGLIYSHRLPGGLWLPGAASNTGAAWIRASFADNSPQELDRAASTCLPGNVVSYPLVGRGERFPFCAPDALGFASPEPASRSEAYAANLVGTALVERLSYTVLDAACGTSGGAVYSTGGGSASDLWMQCRADATARVLHRPCVPESSFGSAILAAANTLFNSLTDATRSMARVARSFEPRSQLASAYDELFGRFLEELSRRGYR